MWSTSRASGRADARSLRTVETRRGVVPNGDVDILAAARGPASPAHPVPAGSGGRDLRPAQPHPGARSRAYVCLLARADRSTFMEAFLLSTGVVFLAELGDKSQLMALTFATKFKARTVLIGITLATAVVHLASVVLGKVVGTALPTGVISLLAGLAFLGFAAWTLRGDTLTEDERSRAATATGSAVLAVGLAFFLAELGNKTMLATITLATDHGLLGTWVGSTLGMVAADALAIASGCGWVGGCRTRS